MGCQEALYYGVPMIGIPLYYDQHRNLAIFVEKKMATVIDFDNLTTASLDEALTKILTNPMYRYDEYLLFRFEIYLYFIM